VPTFHTCDHCGETNYKRATWHVEPSTVVDVKIEQSWQRGQDGEIERFDHCFVWYMAANGASELLCWQTQAEAEARCAELNAGEDAEEDPDADDADADS